jgi:hypothetical protein
VVITHPTVEPCPACLLLCTNSFLPQQNLKDAASWLGYTYLYVRMLGSPALYGVPLGALEDDLELEQHRLDLAHSAAVLLDKHNLIRCVCGVSCGTSYSACVGSPAHTCRLALLQLDSSNGSSST